MSEKKNQQFKNSEAKFASPEDNVGIGYYVEGEEVSPKEFDRRVAEDAAKIRAEEAAREAGTAYTPSQTAGAGLSAEGDGISAPIVP